MATSRGRPFDSRFVTVLVGVAVAAALALGFRLRVSGLERKIVWHDEIMTWLSIAGRTPADTAALRTRASLQAGELTALLEPDRGRGVAATLRGVLANEPHHAPLYFVLARESALALGHVGPRALSALCGLLAIALVGFLARELLDDRLSGWLAASLLAVSPPHVRLAQEARPYALWTAALLAASWLLLRALRSGSRRDWLSYAAVAAAAVYVHPLSLAVLAAHGLCIAVERGLGRALAVVALAVVPCAAWAVLLFEQRRTAQALMAWAAVPMPTAGLARRWVGIATSAFVRVGAEGGLLDGPLAAPAQVAAGLAVLALAAVAARHLASQRSRRAWIFVLTLGAVPALALALPDLALGGRRSAIPRYLVPAWIALELGVAALLAQRLREVPRNAGWALLFVAALSAGGASALRAAPLRTWWDTNPPALRGIDESASKVNAAPATVVVTDAEPLWLLVLARELRQDVTLRLSGDPDPGAFFYDAPRQQRRLPFLTPCVEAADVALWCPSR